MVALYLSFATTAVTCPLSFEEDMLFEAPGFGGGKASKLVVSGVILVFRLLVILLGPGLG